MKIKPLADKLAGRIKKYLRRFRSRASDCFKGLLNQRRIEARGGNSDFHINTCLFYGYFSTIFAFGKEFFLLFAENIIKLLIFSKTLDFYDNRAIIYLALREQEC